MFKTIEIIGKESAVKYTRNKELKESISTIRSGYDDLSHFFFVKRENKVIGYVHIYKLNADLCTAFENQIEKGFKNTISEEINPEGNFFVNRIYIVESERNKSYSKELILSVYDFIIKNHPNMYVLQLVYDKSAKFLYDVIHKLKKGNKVQKLIIPKDKV